MFTYTVDIEQPNAEIYGFKGSIQMEGGTKASLNNNNLLLRGCMIRNTDYIEGLVVYAGEWQGERAALKIFRTAADAKDLPTPQQQIARRAVLLILE